MTTSSNLRRNGRRSRPLRRPGGFGGFPPFLNNHLSEARGPGGGFTTGAVGLGGHLDVERVLVDVHRIVGAWRILGATLLRRRQREHGRAGVGVAARRRTCGESRRGGRRAEAAIRGRHCRREEGSFGKPTRSPAGLRLITLRSGYPYGSVGTQPIRGPYRDAREHAAETVLTRSSE